MVEATPEATPEASPEATPVKSHFSIQKIYVKDASFESPNAPEVFGIKQWDPQIELSINSTHNHMHEQLYEAILTINATAKQDEKTAFVAEVQQAGIFTISGFNDQDLGYLIGSQCMSILLPYARETVSDLTSRGGFPPLILSPVNFDALYQQHVKKQQAEKLEEKPESEKNSASEENTQSKDQTPIH